MRPFDLTYDIFIAAAAGKIQRGHAHQVFYPRVGPLPQQEFHCLYAPAVLGRHHQWRCVVGGFGVDVAIPCEQQAQHFNIALGGSVMHRRPTVLVDSSSPLDELASQVILAGDDGQHQRGLPCQIGGIDIDLSSLQQNRNGFFGLLMNRQGQGSSPFFIAQIGIDSTFNLGTHSTAVVANDRSDQFINRNSRNR